MATLAQTLIDRALQPVVAPKHEPDQPIPARAQRLLIERYKIYKKASRQNWWRDVSVAIATVLCFLCFGSLLFGLYPAIDWNNTPSSTIDALRSIRIPNVHHRQHTAMFFVEAGDFSLWNFLISFIEKVVFWPAAVFFAVYCLMMRIVLKKDTKCPPKRLDITARAHWLIVEPEALAAHDDWYIHRTLTLFPLPEEAIPFTTITWPNLVQSRELETMNKLYDRLCKEDAFAALPVSDQVPILAEAAARTLLFKQ